MKRTMLLAALISAGLVVLAACGGDDDGSATAPEGDGTEVTDSAEDSASSGSDDGAGDSAETDPDDGGGDDAADPNSDDLIGVILSDMGLSSAILDEGERDCVNGELAASVGTLPDDLSLNNTELWDAVNAAAETCDAEIGL